MAPCARMRRSWVVLGLAFVLTMCFSRQSATAVAAKSKGGTSTKSKMEYLEARGPIVSLGDRNFTRYAEGKTRPYHLVLVFTATDPSYKCGACRALETPLNKIAKAYSEQHDIRTEDNPVIFAKVDVADAGKVFQQYAVTTAPHVHLVPMGQAVSATGMPLSDVEVTGALSAPDGRLDGFLHELHQITGAKVIFLPNTSGLLQAALLIGFAFGIAGHLFADTPSRVVSLVRYKGLWFLVSMACYMTGVGGMIYCIIRHAKPFGFDQQTGQPMMFSPGGRDQWVYEGIVVALLYVGISAAVAVAYAAAGWKRAPSMIRAGAVLMSITIMCYLSKEYFKLYVKKTSWYSISGLLPSAMSNLHSMPLKRKHGLARRLVRLSHMWLNEYPGLRPFGLKMKTLLLDYFGRVVKGFVGLS